MQVLSYDDDFLPRVSIEQHNQHHRHHRRASSCCGVPISPNLLNDGLSRNSFSYGKLPQHPFHLTVRKLDGSSFDVEVAKAATVADLKQAVEDVFGYMAREGVGKVSWSHVWLHFCLCYDGWKLLTDSEPISNYGINDGDQLHFVRHLSINYNLISRRSKYRLSALEQPSISPSISDDKDDVSADEENKEHIHYNDVDVTIMGCCESKLARVFGVWFSYRRLGSSPGRRNSFSSRLADGFLGSFRSIVRLCSSNKLNPRKDPLEEV